MTKEQLSSITFPCDKCKANPAKHLKGGVIDKVRGLFLLCDDCVQQIEDERQKERRR